MVTVNLTLATAGMFNEEAFAKRNQRRVLSIFPAARVVDTQALYEALRSGQIAYAAIDVVEPEPLPGDSSAADTLQYYGNPPHCRINGGNA